MNLNQDNRGCCESENGDQNLREVDVRISKEGGVASPHGIDLECCEAEYVASEVSPKGRFADAFCTFVNNVLSNLKCVFCETASGFDKGGQINQ